MILHLLRMRRNVNRKVFNDRKNESATAVHSVVCRQVLHCQRHDGSGGETLLVDGFHAAEQVRAHHPADFRLLCDTSVYHAYMEADHNVRSLAPVLTTQPVTGDLIAIRYNHYDRAVFSATEDVGRWGSHFHFHFIVLKKDMLCTTHDHI